MKMYLNFKKIIFFFGVLFFTFNVAHTKEKNCLELAGTRDSKNGKARWKNAKNQQNKDFKSGQDYCVEYERRKAQATQLVSPTQCLEINKELKEAQQVVNAACTANKSKIKVCESEIEKCKEYEDTPSSLPAAKGDELKKIKKIDKEIKTINNKITKLDNENEINKLKKERDALNKKKTNTALFKQCPIFVTLTSNAYNEARKENKDTRKELKKEHDDIKEKLTELEKEKNTETEKRDDKINKLGEGVLKNQRDFQKAQKKLKKELKDKIAKKTKETEEQQNLIRTLNQKRQELIDNAEKRQFEREDRCHTRALESLAAHKKARVQRIINKTNRISFATLIKRSKLSRKDRNKQYQQKMYTECLGTPSEQKWLKREKKILIQTKISMLKQQEGAVKKIKQAQKDLEKIASENHLEAGELLERSKQDGEQLTQKIELANKNKERVIKNLNKQIEIQKARLKEKQVELKDEDLTDLKTQYALTKDLPKTSKLKLTSFAAVETAIDNRNAQNELLSQNNCPGAVTTNNDKNTKSSTIQ